MRRRRSAMTHSATGIRSIAPSDWEYVDEHAPAPLPANSAVREVAGSLGREFSRTLYATGIDGQCFAAPRDPDSPSLREAMNGPERKEWEAARQAEFENLRRHDAFEEVVEDTLPGWNAAKRRAYEPHHTRCSHSHLQCGPPVTLPVRVWRAPIH